MKKFTTFMRKSMLSVFLLLTGFTGFAQNNGLLLAVNVDSLFTQAQVSMMVGKYPKAFDLFNILVKIQPENPVIHAQLAQLWFIREDSARALSEIRFARRADPENTEYNEQYAQILAGFERYEEAADVFGQIAADTLHPELYLLNASHCYKMAGKYQNALASLEAAEAHLGVESEDILLEKFRLYFLLRDIKGLQGSVQKLLSLCPHDPKYYLSLVSIYNVLNMSARADSLLTTGMKLFPDNGIVYAKALANALERNKEQAKQILKEVLNSGRFSASSQAVVFFPLIRQRKTNPLAGDLLYIYLSRLADSEPPNRNAKLLYAKLMFADNNDQKGLGILKSAIKSNSSDEGLWDALLSYYSDRENIDSLQFYTRKAFESLHGHPLPYYYQATAFYHNNMPDAAILSLEAALPLIEEADSGQRILFNSFLARIFWGHKQLDSAEVYFEAALTLAPDNIEILNSYCFLLAEMGKDLDKAATCAAHVIREEPENPYYLDTYGWILFKQKKYLEAKRYLKQAISFLRTPKALIYEHLGNVESALGNKGRARHYWLRALELDPDSESLKENLAQ